MSEFTLFDYQKTGAAFLAQRRYAALFDEMGVGKTAQVIHGANLARVNTALVVVPHIGMVNWQREIAQWGWKPNSAILSNRRTDAPEPWHVVNYDLLQEPTGALKALRDRRYDLIVLDESQAVKNHGAKRTKNILGRDGLGHNAGRLWPVSGSPCPNNVAELYPILLACFPHVIKSGDRHMSYYEFAKHYCRIDTNAFGDLRVLGSKPSEVAALKEMLRPHMLRRTLKDVLPDLPPLRFSTVFLDPRNAELLLTNSHAQIQLFTALKAATAKMLETIEDVDDAFITALNDMESEALSTQRRLYGEAKAPLVAEMIVNELNSGLDKLVVFYHHQSVGEEICNRLDRYGAARIDGSIAKKWRQPAIDEFQTNPLKRVLLVSLDCGSTVITLTAAAHVLFAECSWTPLTNVQAARRCARLGQLRPVLARFATLAGSLDEIIVAVQARKARGLAHLFATSDYMETDDAFERA